MPSHAGLTNGVVAFYSRLRIEAWGASKLSEQLLAHQDIVEHYLTAPSNAAKVVIGIQHGGQNIAAETVNFTIRTKKGRRPTIAVAGVVANEPEKIGYLKYLIRRYIVFRAWETGKAQMRYAVPYKSYER